MNENRDLKLNFDTHDLEIERFDLVFQDDQLDATRQRLKIRIKFFFTEWFLDTNFGLPYYEIILKKNPNLQEIEGRLIDTIVSTPRVLEILDFNLDFDAAARILFVNFRVLTEDGELIFSENIFPE